MAHRTRSSMQAARISTLLATLLLPSSPVSAPAAPPGTDAEGLPLPEGVVTRIGSARFRHDHPIERMAWSADGKQIAAAGFWGGIRVWRFDNGRTIRHIPPQ